MAVFWPKAARDATDEAADPWLLWAATRAGTLSVDRRLVERGRGGMPPSRLRMTGWQIPAIYADTAPFFTALAPLEGGGRSMGGNRCVAGGSAPLAVAPGAAVGARPEAPAYTVNTVNSVNTANTLNTVNTTPRVAPMRSSAASPTPVVAVIDSTIAFLHTAFRGTDRKTRILRLWDQGEAPAAGSAWRAPGAMGYGRELWASDIDAVIASLPDTSAEAEARAYRACGQRVEEWSHGTHVLALAAGCPDPSRMAPSSPAAEFPIIAVQVPQSEFGNTGGNWLNTYVLDALHYILAAVPEEVPVVVNLSMGGHSGPHDGSSILERAIDALIVAQAGRLTVVVAAGNSRQQQVHARIELGPSGGPAPSATSLAIDMPPDDSTANFIEAWVDARLNGQAARLAFRLCPPDEKPSAPIRPQAGSPCSAFLLNDRNGTVAMLHASAVGDAPNGSGTQVVMAVGPAAAFGADSDRAARAGRWRLDIVNESAEPVVIDAWIARDDTLGGAGEQRAQKRFAALGPGASLAEERTMSSCAWGQHVIAVGGYETDDAGVPARMYAGSGCGFGVDGGAGAGAGAGPAPGQGPHVCGPARLGVEGVGRVPFLSGGVAPRTARVGTSMAAPVVARRIAAILAVSGPCLMSGLLATLRRQCASAAISPSGQVTWTSDYWLPP